MSAYIVTSASISGDYRYRLGRAWAGGPTCTFIMLNPSTADADQDDPTIRRCVGFAKALGCGALEVVNLYAYRATNPRDLLRQDERVGPENDYWLREAQLDPPSRDDGAVINMPLARRMPTDNQIAELAQLVHERDRLRAEVGA